MGEVGEFEFEFVEFFFEFAGFGLEVFDGGFEGGGVGLGLLGFVLFALAHELADGLADSVGFGLFFLEFDKDVTPGLVGRQKLVDGGVDAFARGADPDSFGVFANEFAVEHDREECT